MNTEAKEIATTVEQLPQDQPVAQPLQIAPANPILEIINGAVQAGIGVEELSKLLEMKREYDTDEARKAFAAASAKFQGLCPPIRKVATATITSRKGSGSSFSYTFPPYDEIKRTIQPHLKATGLSVTFSDFKVENGILDLACIITHVDGHSERYPFAVPVDNALTVNDMQKVGIANSYCKRYALCNALDLTGTDVDTDGNGASAEKREKAKAKRKPQNPATEEQIANLQDHLESGKLSGRDTEYITANLGSMTKLDAAGILDTLKLEQSA